MNKRKFVVYEIWTRSRVVTMDDDGNGELDVQAIYARTEPEPMDEGWSLSNWHVVDLEDPEQEQASGGLNYRQV